MSQSQREKVGSAEGFIAALDQSGGSTPEALRQYGVEEAEYDGETEMFDLIHQMRTRIMTSPNFTGDKVLGAILFEQTMDREVQGKGTADFLWSERQVVPFLKVDKGLADEANGAQLMKPIPALDDLLSRAREKGVFGTKMRSVVKIADPAGVKAAVDQQFEVGHQILNAGLVPIIEPEVDIHSPSKAEAEELLRSAITEHADGLAPGQEVMLKLTLPEQANFYSDLIAHDRILRVVALSGGYSKDDANRRLAENNGIIASFSRALAEGLSAQQSDEEFNTMLGRSIDAIHAASCT